MTSYRLPLVPPDRGRAVFIFYMDLLEDFTEKGIS